MKTSSSVIVPVRELLGRNNYEKWSIFMKQYLVSQDLWDIVQSSQVPKESEKKREWDRKNALALHVLTISCEANVLDQIIKDINDVSAETVWDKLASINTIKQDVVDESEPAEGKIGPGNNAISELLDGLAMGKSTIVLKNCLEKVREYELVIQDMYGDTALSLAALNGRVDIAKLLVEKKSDLLTIKDAKGNIPVQWACERGYEEAARFLYRETPWEALDPKRGGCGSKLLIDCMNLKLFDIVFDLLQNFPSLESELCFSGPNDRTAILRLAQSSKSSFSNVENRLGFLKQLIYNCIPVEAKLIKPKTNDNDRPVNGQAKEFIMNIYNFLLDSILVLIFLIIFLLPIPPALLVALITCMVRFCMWCCHCGVRKNGFQIALERYLTIVGILMWLTSKLVTIVLLICIVVMKLSQLLALLLWRLLQKLWKLIGIKQIYDLKLNYTYARKLLELICRQLGKLNKNQLVQKGAVEATFLAIKNGIPEIANGFINANDNILWSQLDLEDHSRNIFVTAVNERQEDVARFLYVSFHRLVARTTAFKDAQENSILHVAAKLAPDAQLTHISSAAIQLQSELRWFKGVEDICPPFFNELKNRDDETPSQVFIREHKSLLKEAEGWMKKTSESATVVGALIITIMFASTFTVPGGNNQETGLPIFSGHGSFQIFLIFNAISLAAASSSVLMFLGILTSRYAWEDFFKSLPLKLNLGLSLLFISIVTMMGAFCAAVFIMLQGQLRMVIPIVLLANAPVIFFIMLQFPLFLEIYNSTFRPGIFQKNISLIELLNKEISDIYDLSKDWTKKVNEQCSSMQSSIKGCCDFRDDENEEVQRENGSRQIQEGV